MTLFRLLLRESGSHLLSSARCDPGSQTIWMQVSPSGLNPRSQDRGRTRPGLLLTTSRASALATLVSSRMPRVLVEQLEAFCDAAFQFPSTEPALHPIRRSSACKARGRSAAAGLSRLFRWRQRGDLCVVAQVAAAWQGLPSARAPSRNRDPSGCSLRKGIPTCNRVQRIRRRRSPRWSCSRTGSPSWRQRRRPSAHLGDFTPADTNRPMIDNDNSGSCVSLWSFHRRPRSPRERSSRSRSAPQCVLEKEAGRVRGCCRRRRPRRCDQPAWHKP